jgi:hypothetical protein
MTAGAAAVSLVCVSMAGSVKRRCCPRGGGSCSVVESRRGWRLSAVMVVVVVGELLEVAVVRGLLLGAA